MKKSGVDPRMPWREYLIGAYRQCSHCSWQWTDGSPMTAIPWAPYEPNGSAQGDNCMRLFVRPEEDEFRFVIQFMVTLFLFQR